MTALAPTLQAFFTERLIHQRQASPHTLAAYQDTMRLLLIFASAKKGMEPSKLDIGDLDAPLIGAFLDHLEKQRQNCARTRNARLAAIGSLFRYAALRHPEHAAVCAATGNSAVTVGVSRRPGLPCRPGGGGRAGDQAVAASPWPLPARIHARMYSSAARSGLGSPIAHRYRSPAFLVFHTGHFSAVAHMTSANNGCVAGGSAR